MFGGKILIYPYSESAKKIEEHHEQQPISNLGIYYFKKYDNNLMT